MVNFVDRCPLYYPSASLSTTKLPIMEKISARLARFREQHDLSQVESGKLLGVSGKYVGMLEREEKTVDDDSTLSRLLSLYENSGIPGRSPNMILKAGRLRSGMSPADAARAIGYKDTATYLAIEEGRSQMGERMAERASQVFDIPLDQLLSGSDHPPERGAITGTFGSKPEIEMGPGMEDSRAKFIPLLSMAQCGSMRSYDDAAYTREGVVAFDSKDSKAFALRLEGDSMSDKYEAGDIVIVYPQAKPKNGKPVVARLTDEAGGDTMFKLYHASGDAITLTSYNHRFYPPLTFEKKDFLYIYPVAGALRMFL